MNIKGKTRKLVITALLMGIIVMLSLTPLGFIPIGPVKATTMHIPVIIASVVEGPAVGAMVGLFFGLSSMFNAYTNPTAFSFIFMNPIVAVLPRILIGIAPYYVMVLLKNVGIKRIKYVNSLVWIALIAYLAKTTIEQLMNGGQYVNIAAGLMLIVAACVLFYRTVKFDGKDMPIAISALVGSMTNTVLVLTLLYLIYGKQYGALLNMDLEQTRSAILAIAASSGSAEAIGSMIITSGVAGALLKGKR